MLDRTHLTGTWLATVALAVVLAATVPASAYPRPGRTERVSLTNAGAETPEFSSEPSISDDGRYAMFEARSAMVPDDTNNNWDIYVHDRITGLNERVSLKSDGTQATGHALDPDMSPNGRFVVFSASAKLTPEDTNPNSDVFLRDRNLGLTELVSVNAEGRSFAGGAGAGHVSADGRYVSWATGVQNLLPADTNSTFDIFVWDRVERRLELVSASGAGAVGNGESFFHAMSGDGRFIAFPSLASNLVAGDTNGTWDVFVRDRQKGTTERVSVATDGTQANAGSVVAQISPDGRYVVFSSYASNLVPGDANPLTDVFVRDRVAGTTERVSVASDGSQPNSSSFNAWISADGRYAIFSSAASNLVPGDTNGQNDVFVHDRETGVTERVSVTSQGAQATGNNASSENGITPGGRYAIFQSNATNLVPGDTNGQYDVFVRDRGPEAGIGGLTASVSEGQIRADGWASFSGGTVTAVDDPADDGQATGVVSADQLSGELTHVAVAHRPETSELLIRWRVRSLLSARAPAPGAEAGVASAGLVPGLAATPAVAYRLDFQIGGIPHRVFGPLVSASAVPGSAPQFALLRCQGSCQEVARFGGSIGTTGTEARTVVPISLLGTLPMNLTAVKAFAYRGEGVTGQAITIDLADLPPASLAVPAVALGLAPAGTPEGEIAFGTSAPLTNGTFSGSLDASGLEPGAYDLWARGCLANACGTARAPVQIGS